MAQKTIESWTDAIVARIGAVPVLALVALIMFVPGFVTLPPMDRDESRFAQASKQMLETSDFVAIRFGAEARNKKPVGIHWLQAGAVHLAELAGVPDARHRIWLYRIPSLIGAIATVLLTYWAALPLVSRRGAVLAGLFIASVPLLGVEARLAATDAVLSATVAAAIGAMIRIYLADRGDRLPAVRTAMVFWVALAIGVLIKGPITPMVTVFAAVVLSARTWSLRWIKGLRPLPGMILCLLIALPWFVLILLKTHGAFFTEAIGHDLLAKVRSGQEMHGAPPGFYAAVVWLTGWPMAPFLAIGVPTIWRLKGEPKALVLLAWAVPSWLLFEAVPTKLLHYPLPLFPALAILAVFGLERFAVSGRRYGEKTGWIFLGLLLLGPAAGLAVVAIGEGRLWSLTPPQVVAAILIMSASAILVWTARRALLEDRPYGAGAWAVCAVIPIYLFLFGWLLSPGAAEALALSPRLADAASAALGPDCPDALYATVGDFEPSVMFVTNGRLLMTDAEGAARFLAEGPCRVAFVEDHEAEAFKAALDPGLEVERAADVRGFAINGGRKLDMGVYMRQGGPP